METKAQGKRDINIFGFLKYLLDKKKILIIAACVALLASSIYCFLIATPMYEATSQIYVVNSQDSAIDLSDLQIGSYLTSDYQLIFQTWEVNQMVIDNLNLPYTVKEMRERLTVENPSNTRILNITFSSSNPKEAADVSNEYSTVVSQYISDMMLAQKPSIISRALEPLTPSKPRKLLIISLSVVITVVMAAWVLFIVFLLDDRIKTAEDVLRYLDTEPLAVIPYKKTERR